MKKTLLFLLPVIFSATSLFSQSIDPSEWGGMVGYWTFDDPSDLTKATVGTALELIGSDLSVDGPSAGDKATRIGIGSHYKCTHGIEANGGGSYVNQYSFLVDFKVSTLGTYYSFYQTSTDNSNDGDLFIDNQDRIGLNGLGGYSDVKIEADKWYRLVVSVDLGNHYNIYLDGTLIKAEDPQSVDGQFSLDPYFYFFADENGEDNEFDIAATAVFDYPLTAAEAATLGTCTDTGTGIHDKVAGTLGLNNFPNPIKSSTKIQFETTNEEWVTLEVYSLGNKKVTSILNNVYLAPGRHEYVWNPDNELATGVYILRLITKEHIETSKMILMKR